MSQIQVQVQILQQDYVLSCPQGHEQELLAAVERVDADMERIRVSGKVRARERVGVLAAVNLAYEVRRLQSQIAELQQALAAAAQREPVPESASEAVLDAQQIEALVQRIDQALDHGDNRLL